MHATDRLRSTVRGSHYPAAPGGETREFSDLTGDVTFVQDIEIVPEIRPGRRVSLSYTIDFGDLGADFFLDPNFCITDGAPGVNFLSEIEVDGLVADSNNYCRQPDPTTVQHSFLGPTEIGQYPVDIVIVRPSDGVPIREVTAGTLTVTDDPVGGDCPTGFIRDPDTGECVPSGGNGGDGGGGPLLPCFLDPNRACSTGETIAYTAVGGAVGILLLGQVLD